MRIGVWSPSGYRLIVRNILIEITRPLLDDSRVPHPLETIPIEYIPH